MFLEHYGLKEQPFGVSPDPRFLFPSVTHREALASLHYGVTGGRGFFALIAQPGMGKTTLLVQLLQRLRPCSKTVFLFQMQSSPRDLLRNLLADLGISSDDGDLVRIHSKLNEILLAEAHAGRRFVLVIDEAQNLDCHLLEVVRMLSNFETPKDKLMQIILAGQPQLAAKLAAPGMVQLRQRLAMIARLKPLTFEETESYIQHRLQIAGLGTETTLFTPGALHMIARHSVGIPRNINMLCFSALSLGCALQKPKVDEEIMREVLSDQDLRAIALEPFTRRTSAPQPAAPQFMFPKPEKRRLLHRWAPRLVFGCALAGATALVSVGTSPRAAGSGNQSQDHVTFPVDSPSRNVQPVMGEGALSPFGPQAIAARTTDISRGKRAPKVHLGSVPESTRKARPTATPWQRTHLTLRDFQ